MNIKYIILSITILILISPAWVQAAEPWDAPDPGDPSSGDIPTPYIWVISEPSPAMVIIDNKSTGYSPFLFITTPGMHHIIVQIPGYESYTETVSLSQLEHADIEAHLIRNPTGIIVINSIQSLDIYINGEYTGKSPGVLTGIEIGTVLVEANNEDGDVVFSESIDVSDGKTTFLTFEMNDIAPETEPPQYFEMNDDALEPEPSESVTPANPSTPVTTPPSTMSQQQPQNQDQIPSPGQANGNQFPLSLFMAIAAILTGSGITYMSNRSPITPITPDRSSPEQTRDIYEDKKSQFKHQVNGTLEKIIKLESSRRMHLINPPQFSSPIYRKPIFLGISFKEAMIVFSSVIIYIVAFTISNKSILDLGNLLIFLPITVLAVIGHELSRNFFAKKYNCNSEFRIWSLGVIIMLITGAFFSSVFGKPSRSVMEDIEKQENKNKKRIVVAGPLFNIIFGLLFLVLIPIGGMISIIGVNGALVNILIGAFTLIPIPPLEGKILYSTDKLVWCLLFIPSIIGYIIIFSYF